MSQYYYNPFGNSNVMEEREKALQLQRRKMAEKKEIRKISFTMGCAIIAYLLVQTLFVGALAKTEYYELFETSSVFEGGVMIIVVSFLSVLVPFGVMALINKKKYAYPVIPNKAISVSKAFLWICFGMACCVLINMGSAVLISAFNEIFNVKMETNEQIEPDSVFACALQIISLAVIPAICEEFAMRCCSLQLLRKYGKGFSVFAVSIVFGLLHGNVPQFIFAFSVGLILGYITIKTDSIVPVVFIHGFNNGISVFSSIIKYSFGDKYSTYAIFAAYIIWGVLGAISAIVLFSKGEFAKGRKDCSSVLTNGEKFSAFLFPGMIVPFGILILITSTTINTG